MPIHFDDLDVVSEVSGLASALIVPCNMCPAVTVALRENKPFMQLNRSFLKSAPFEEHQSAPIAVRRKGSQHGSIQEQFVSPMVHVHVDCKPAKEAAETGKTA